MKNDTANANMNEAAGQKQGTGPAIAEKSGEDHGKRLSGERMSLAGERAEGEGMIAPDPENDQSKVEGEGSYTATHNYDAGVERSVAEGRTEELAQKAAKALDGPEGDELRKAEQAAKQGQST